MAIAVGILKILLLFGEKLMEMELPWFCVRVDHSHCIFSFLILCKNFVHLRTRSVSKNKWQIPLDFFLTTLRSCSALIWKWLAACRNTSSYKWQTFASFYFHFTDPGESKETHFIVQTFFSIEILHTATVFCSSTVGLSLRPKAKKQTNKQTWEFHTFHTSLCLWLIQLT